jgi:hypothetical protein
MKPTPAKLNYDDDHASISQTNAPRYGTKNCLSGPLVRRNPIALQPPLTPVERIRTTFRSNGGHGSSFKPIGRQLRAGTNFFEFLVNEA